MCPRVNGTVCIGNKNKTIKYTATQVTYLERGDSYNFARYRFGTVFKIDQARFAFLNSSTDLHIMQRKKL